MKRSKHLKEPLILFLVLILTAGIAVAASGDTTDSTQDSFGTDADNQAATTSSNSELRSGFGSDTDDAGAESETTDQTAASESADGDDAGTSRDGFGDDTDDAEFTQTEDDSENTTTEGDAGTSRDGFGDDTDDDAPSSSDNDSRDGFGDDTDDEGSSNDGFGDDTDDEGSSRDGFGNEDNETENNETEGENETETDSDSDSDGDSTSYDPADVEIVETTDTGPSVEVESVDWPNSVRQGNSFQVCAEISASETPEVTLLKNGVEVDSASQNGNNCFTATLDQPGDHTLEIRAELDDAQDSETTTVNAYTIDTGSDNQETDNTGDNTSTNNALIIVAILAVIAIGAGAIYRRRG